jgi:proline iminopeptidase
MAGFSFYPEIEPFDVHHLKVSDLHTLYIEEVGNPEGIPVVYLHGGPGAGLQAKYRRFFDPQIFRVILYGQRGSVPSDPLGEVRENTTQLLIEDIETIREHFKIEQWIVFGGSWGSTLALAYALEHTQRVSALVLRGIYLGNQRQNDWLYKDGAGRLFPEQWQKFSGFIPEAERGDLVSAYYRRLMDDDPTVHLPAARAWTDWEGSLIHLVPEAESELLPDDVILSMARVECHYMYNDLFFPEDDYLLHSVHKLNAIPCFIVQGRYDVICPAEAAVALAAELPQARLNIVPTGAHSGSEPEMASRLIEAMLELSEKRST